MPGEPARWTQQELDSHMRKFGTVLPVVGPTERRSSVPRKRTINKTEAAYDAFLFQQQSAGLIVRYRYESVTLLLADGCRYTPDFEVVQFKNTGNYDHCEFHEVKGTRKRKSGVVGPHIEDDARVKLLTAAKLYPEFTFKLCWLDQGRWKIEEISR